jgi:hypothetical protein
LLSSKLTHFLQGDLYLLRTFKLKLLVASAAFSLVSTLSAGIIGTHDFAVSSTGSTTITSSPAGSYTDPNYGTFCVGPNTDNCSQSGLAGSYTFADISPTLSQITFSFIGSTFPAFSPGSFRVVLSNLGNAGTTITGIALSSSNISSFSDFSFGVSWDGTNATFTGTPIELEGDDFTLYRYEASGRSTAIFDVTLRQSGPPTPEIPEPSTYALLGAGLVSLFAFRRRLSR